MGAFIMATEQKNKRYSNMAWLIVEMLEVFNRQDIYETFISDLKKKGWGPTVEEKKELARLKKSAKVQYKKCVEVLKGFEKDLKENFTVGR